MDKAQLTGVELNVAIAKALGYTVKWVQLRHHIAGYKLHNPDGTMCEVEDFEPYADRTEELAWPRQCPDWAGDANLALSLCLDIARPNHYSVQVAEFPDGFYARLLEEFAVEKNAAEKTRYMWEKTSAFGSSDAEALARLALKALQSEPVTSA